MTLLRNKVFYRVSQVKMSSLGWAVIKMACILMKRRNLETNTLGENYHEHHGRDLGDAFTS